MQRDIYGKVPKGAKGYDWKPLFLEHYERFANVQAACRYAGVSQPLVNKLAHDNPEWRAEMEAAKERAIFRLEKRSWELATDEKAPSERMLIFMLKSHMPGTYDREKVLKLKGDIDNPLSLDVNTVQDRLKLLAQDSRAAKALQILAEVEAELVLGQSMSDVDTARTNGRLLEAEEQGVTHVADDSE
jgi:hypothetical protein